MIEQAISQAVGVIVQFGSYFAIGLLGLKTILYSITEIKKHQEKKAN